MKITDLLSEEAIQLDGIASNKQEAAQPNEIRFEK